MSPSNPYPQTALMGDEAYMGFNYLWQGWFDTSQFFINGFRDAEFTYLDTLVLTPSTVPHQTVVLKQETTEFFGGQTLARGVNVHNDTHATAKFLLRWLLIARDGRLLCQDQREADTRAGRAGADDD